MADSLSLCAFLLKATEQAACGNRGPLEVAGSQWGFWAGVPSPRTCHLSRPRAAGGSPGAASSGGRRPCCVSVAHEHGGPFSLMGN